MSKETKIGLALILVLLGAFGLVMYKKMNKAEDLLANIKQADDVDQDDNSDDDGENGSSGKHDDDSDSHGLHRSDDLHSGHTRFGSSNEFDGSGVRQQHEPDTYAQRTSSSRFDSGFDEESNPFEKRDDGHQHGSQQEQTRYGHQAAARLAFESSRQDSELDEDDPFGKQNRSGLHYSPQQNQAVDTRQLGLDDTRQSSQDFGSFDDYGNQTNNSADQDRGYNASQDATSHQHNRTHPLADRNDSSGGFGGNEFSANRDQTQQGYGNQHGYGSDREDHFSQDNRYQQNQTAQTQSGTENGLRHSHNELHDDRDTYNQYSQDNARSFEQPEQSSQQHSANEFSSSGTYSSDSAEQNSFGGTESQSGATYQHQYQHQHETTNRYGRPNAYSQQSPSNDPNVRLHVVQANDSYWAISKKQYGTARYFSALERYNRDRIPNPKRMRIGMKVLIPERETLVSRFPDLFPGSSSAIRAVGYADSDGSAVVQSPGFFFDRSGAPKYRIGAEDTLTQIAQRHLGRSSRWVQIFEINRNGLQNPNNLKIGTVLSLPADASQVDLVPSRSGIR